MGPRVEPEGDDLGDEGFSACQNHHVIPVQTGIQRTASAVQKTSPAGRTARCWIPACAGMTMRMAGRVALPHLHPCPHRMQHWFGIAGRLHRALQHKFKCGFVSN